MHGHFKLNVYQNIYKKFVKYVNKYVNVRLRMERILLKREDGIDGYRRWNL